MFFGVQRRGLKFVMLRQAYLAVYFAVRVDLKVFVGVCMDFGQFLI